MKAAVDIVKYALKMGGTSHNTHINQIVSKHARVYHNIFDWQNLYLA